MERDDKQFIKIAGTIRDQLQRFARNRYQEVQQLMGDITSQQEQLNRQQRVLGTCLGRHWPAAVGELTQRIRRILRDLPFSIEELDRMLQATETPVPDLRQIYEELAQLHQEFDRVDYDPKEQCLSVFTDDIELEGVYLGDFELRLSLGRLSEVRQQNTLRVIAHDPHPASTNDLVTHPHVSDEYLCTGDASVPMQQALMNGRLCDYFLLAKAVLETYNPGSPYVRLGDWEGSSCYACGYTVSDEGGYYCEHCQETFCDDCMGYCESCHTSLCQSCMTTCPVCENSRCGECMSKCAACGQPVCLSCREDNLCPSCKEESETENESKSESESIEPLTTHVA